ncbi:hypothetical protein PEC331060_18080 [Pectobacterium carotovorum subsp. carotovorum]|nr:hypothetical protein PEC301653_23340 [Pectobacterium carotovorum subsp. carotovorum]GKW28630.1 hypothetical protein PEC331060_18080 [Pectobacterium carotovorum subsp. carotovorum]
MRTSSPLPAFAYLRDRLRASHHVIITLDDLNERNVLAPARLAR